MSSALARARSGFRHRIQEITLSPNLSKHSIELELLIDDEPVYGLPVVEAGSSLHWNMDSYPCDVRRDSKIKLKITEKHFPSLRNRVGYSEYLVSDVADKLSIDLKVGDPTSQSMGFGSTAKHWDHGGPFTISMTFPDWNKVKDAYMVALGKADTMADSEKGPLEGLGKYRDVLKTLIDVGKKVAGVYPAAEVVVERCAAVWEHLEKVQQLHDDMRKLLDGIEKMLPFIDFLKEHATENLLTDTITALLNLIEDSSNFMIAYLSKNAAVRLLRSAFDDSAPGRVGGLLQEFTELKEDFDRSVRVQLLGSVLTTAQRSQIDRLNPAAHSQYAYTQACQDGTRQQILGEINNWLDDQNTGEKLLWLYGNAGLGKSSIAASICAALNTRETLGAHFFCKRDDSDLRSPDRILNTIVHRLATKYKEYGHAVSRAIDSDAELPNLPLYNRYKSLVEEPLKTLASKHKSPGLLVVVVDAFDECDKGDGRRSLLTYLRGLSALLPWIKVIVTSRPDPDIKAVFGKPDDTLVCARNAHEYDASGDIYLYTRDKMAGIALERQRADWPDDTIQLLSQRAGGLFIWAATACRFISDAVNVDERLKRIMEGTQPAGIDMLYTTAIRQSMESDDEDNIEYTRQCIAAIVATASRTPLSVPSLEKLFCSRFGTGTFRYVVNRLGSVLYEDNKTGNAVRVYHPSFADYVLNPTRSKEIHVETDSINTTLADCCLTTMLRELRFNICGLETSHLLNRDVPNLEDRVRSAIGEHLEYSCVHWASHLTAALNGTLKAQLGEFLLSPVLLFWIEALSLLSRLSVALSSLKGVTDRILSMTKIYAACAHDAYRFVLAFYDAISQSTPHLYISALPLAPKNSMIAERMWPLFPNMFRMTGDAGEHWSACMRTISLDGGLHSAAVSPDGRLIATSSKDSILRLWDAETGEAAYDPLECSPGGLAFSHDGRRLFCRHHEGGITAWSTETFEPILMTLPTTSQWCSEIALSCHNRLAVSSSNENVVAVWDLRSSTVAFEMAGPPRRLGSIAFSPNGLLIASSYRSNIMRIWDAQTGATLFDQSVSVSCVAFSPDSHHLVSGAYGGIVQIWDISTGTIEMELQGGRTSHVDVIAYSPDGGNVVCGCSDSTLWIWDLNIAPASATPLIGHTNSVHSVSFSPNGRHVISGSFDGTVKIWDVDTHATSFELGVGHSSEVTNVVFSPDGRHVLSTSYDVTLSIWNADTGRPTREPITNSNEAGQFVAISPDAQRAVSRCTHEISKIWDIGTGVWSSKALIGAEGFIHAAAFSLDSSRLVSGFLQENTLQVHDAETGVSLLGPLVGHQDIIASLAFSPCNCFITSGSYDNTVRVWSAETGATVGEPLEHDEWVYSVTFSPDGHLIASGLMSGTIRVWDVEKRTPIHNLISRDHSINCLRFSPNGRLLVSGAWYQTVRIWDMESDTPVSEPLLGHTDSVVSLAFSPDGRLIASGSDDRTVRIWDVANTSAKANISLTRLTALLYPSANALSGSTDSVPQLDAEHSPPDLTLSTSCLAHRLSEGGWVSLAEDSVLLWLPEDYRMIDDSIVQISARPLGRYSIDFSKFVHGDRWMSVASDSVRCYDPAA